MVTIRCKMVVKSELEKLGVHYTSIDLGEAEVKEEIPPEKIELLRIGLKKQGLELMDDKKSILVEKIKAVIIELVHYNDKQLKINLSDYLTEKLNH
ncbi:MAG: AraC family transcriptional regulator, partial [Bacteroidales bacterium]